jgi:tetratricopeptide (TPR) repeat protein
MAYLKALSKSLYRPIKPVVSPLLKKITLTKVFSLLVLIGAGGLLVNGFSIKAQERASRWPWSSKSHSQMALAWFEAGDEDMALNELEVANKLLIVKTRRAKNSLKEANDKVMEPEKIREEIVDWEKILGEMPSFKDVFLRLAVLNYQLYNETQARDYFEKAEYLDPNNEEILEIKKIIF